MKKGKIKETTTIEKNMHGIKACRGMTLQLKMREIKLATEITGLLRKCRTTRTCLSVGSPSPTCVML